jgi:hypothetical protein
MLRTYCSLSCCITPVNSSKHSIDESNAASDKGCLVVHHKENDLIHKGYPIALHKQFFIVDLPDPLNQVINIDGLRIFCDHKFIQAIANTAKNPGTATLGQYCTVKSCSHSFTDTCQQVDVGKW